MSDLIERLKKSQCRLCLDAWDEIERLTAEIQQANSRREARDLLRDTINDELQKLVDAADGDQ